MISGMVNDNLAVNITMNVSQKAHIARFNRLQKRSQIAVLHQLGFRAKKIANLVNNHIITVYKWTTRLKNNDDLCDRKRSGRPPIYDESIQLKIVSFYCQSHPLPKCGKWTVRWAALHLQAHPEQIGANPSKSTIHRILKKNKLKPHQSRYFLHITDPEFFPKMEHLVKLFMTPPPFLFFFDECPGIKILKRLLPDLQTDEMIKRL